MKFSQVLHILILVTPCLVTSKCTTPLTALGIKPTLDDLQRLNDANVATICVQPDGLCYLSSFSTSLTDSINPLRLRASCISKLTDATHHHQLLKQYLPATTTRAHTHIDSTTSIAYPAPLPTHLAHHGLPRPTAPAHALPLSVGAMSFRKSTALEDSSSGSAGLAKIGFAAPTELKIIVYSCKSPRVPSIGSVSCDLPSTRSLFPHQPATNVFMDIEARLETMQTRMEVNTLQASAIFKYIINSINNLDSKINNNFTIIRDNVVEVTARVEAKIFSIHQH